MTSSISDLGVRTIRTTCNRDCPDACSMIAHVEDGKVVRVTGDREHPVTNGFLCYRTERFPRTLQKDPGRLLEPMARRSWLSRMRSGKVGPVEAHGRLAALAEDPLEPVGWDEVLDLLARELLRIKEESGPGAILNYRSGGSLGLLKHLTDLLFERFGPCAVKRGDICSGAGDAAQMADFGEEDSHPLSDLANSKSIILWGKNPFVSNVHLLPHLRAARARGAAITLIDPVHHETARLSDLYLQPRPGGDLALAFAVASLLRERKEVTPGIEDWTEGLTGFWALVDRQPREAWLGLADVTPEAAAALCDRLCQRPAAILVGWGMQRRSQGGAIVRALSALSALSGNLGVPGGGSSFYFKRRGAFDVSFVRGLEAAPRSVSEPQLGRGLIEATDPPVRAVWITCGNPVAMLPESATVARALESRELTVVCDSFLTDSARRAHVVLPTATMLEQEDLVGAYGHHYLGSVRQVVSPPPGVKTDLEIAQALADRLGVGQALAGSARDWKRRILRNVAPLGASLEAIEAGPVRNPLAPDVLFADRRFPTPSGRMQFLAELPLDPSADVGASAGYDLWLLSNSTRRSQSSQWSASRAEHASQARVHPETAARVGLAHGDAATLESPIGRMEVRLVTDANQRRDVVIVPKGGWFDDGQCANALIAARVTDMGEGAAYLDAKVRIRPATD
ncbi:MAG: molybdopterin-containing oxidoreductase family protein [Planctomycetota bacterium]|jgi:anaerobic selenocysteine-containing dehydrogenase